MKKTVLLFWFMLFAVSVFSQTATNADGTLRFRGNVAILVESQSFTFQNGQYVKQVDDETMSALKTVIRALCMEKFQDICFAVVNRDDDAFLQVSQLIKENKLEDYLDGVSVSAKNQGADYLFLANIVCYGEDDSAVQIEISTRLINVENNMGYHTFYRSDAILLKDENDMRNKVKQIINDFSASFESFLQNIFPEQYYIAKSDGKTLSLGAYQPNGRIMSDDKFYAFKFQKENMKMGQDSVPVQILQKVSTCGNPISNGGYLQVKSDKSLTNTSDVVLVRNVSQPVFQGTNQMTMTFFGLDYNLDSYDGLTKNRINNAVFSAITLHSGLQLIEHDHLPDLKNERELQKSEDFIDGHVVEQMKAIGAMYLLKLENYERNEAQVSFKISLISVAENRIIRAVDVKTSIDNIENEMYKQICDRIAYPCAIKQIDKKTYRMTSIICLQEGDECVLSKIKQVQNPMTGETSFSVVEVCNMTVKEYCGNMCVVSVDKVISEEDMETLEVDSSNRLITFKIDGTKIKSNLDSQSDVKKKAEKNEKGSSIWKNLKEAAKNNVKITVKQWK